MNKKINSKFLCTVLCAVFLTSCGVETPIFYGKPFIVGKIEVINDTLCVYTAKEFTLKGTELFASKQRFIAKQRLFQIGDTVTICK